MFAHKARLWDIKGGGVQISDTSTIYLGHISEQKMCLKIDNWMNLTNISVR